MKYPFGKPVIGVEERLAIEEVLQSGILVHGSKTTGFELAFASYTKAPYAVTVSSCTAGMHLIYFTLNIGEGDEVIVPAQTHVATAHAVEFTGAKPVFVDSERSTGNIDIDRLEAAITSATKAITVVHYLGVPVDMSRVLKIAKDHNLFVFEDCALSPGAKVDGTHTGLLGDAGIFSFYPVKHITSAEGGMIILKDEELCRKLQLKKAFGVDRTHGMRKDPGLYDVVDLGFNYRMSEIHAAIGVEQLKKLPFFLQKRAENKAALLKRLGTVSGIELMSSPPDRLKSSDYCVSILLDKDLAFKRQEIMRSLSARGIGCSIYYPQPVPRMSYYKRKYGYDPSAFVEATRYSDQSIALPIGPHLEVADMERIGDELKSIIEDLQ